MASRMALDNQFTDEIMKRRLLIDGDGVGDDRRILALMRAFVQFCTNKGTDPTTREKEYRRLLSSLHQVEMSFLRTQEMIRVNQESRTQWMEVGQELKTEVEETKTSINEYKQLVEDATKHRKHAMEYDALAKLIKTQPDRKMTEEKKGKLEGDLSVLQTKEKGLKLKLEARKQNLKILTSSIERLKDLIKGEDEEATGSGVEVEVDEVPMEVDPPKEDKKGSTSKSKDKDKLHEDLSEDEEQVS